MLRLKWFVDVNDHQAGWRRNVGVLATERDVPCSIQQSFWIPGCGPGQEVVLGIAVGQGIDVGHDQAFLGIRDEGVVVARMEGLLLIGDSHEVTLITRGRNRLIGGQGHTGRILRGDVGVLTERRIRRGHDALRHPFVRNIGRVIDPESALTLGHKQILPAQLQATDRSLCGVVVRLGQLLPAVLMFLVIVRICITLEIAANHGLRLIPLGDRRGLDMFTQTNPGVMTHKIDEVRSLQEQLRHDRVVIVLRRNVAIATSLGLFFALGVRVMRRERLRGMAAGRDRGLLDIELLAVDIG